MTKKQIVEDIKGHFPILGETEIMVAFNRVYVEFCAKTRIYTAVTDLTLTTAVSYTIPTTVGQIYRIDFKDSSDNDIASEDRLTYRIEHSTIYFYDTDGNTLSIWPTSIAKVTLNYYKIPTSIVSTEESIAINTKYTEPIIAGTLTKFYAKIPVEQIINGNKVYARDWQAVKYWSGIYHDGIVMGMQEANRQQDATTWNPALQNFNINE